MPRPKHLVTPTFGFEYPELGAEGNAPEDFHQLALQVENLLKAFPPADIQTAGAGDEKKLLIVQATGAPAFKAMSGDATITAAGALTIANLAVTNAKLALLAVTEAILAGEAVSEAKIKALAVTAAKLAAEAVETGKIKNLAVTEGKIAELAVTAIKIAAEAVTTAKIQNLAVTEEKVADGAISSRKFKPTRGQVNASGGTNLTNAYQVCTGMTMTFKPPVTTIVQVVALAQTNITEVKAGVIIRVGVHKNAVLVGQESNQDMSLGKNWPVFICQEVEVAANEEATIDIRAKKSEETGAASILAGNSRMVWQAMSK